MKKYHLTPGPSEIYFTVGDHIREALNFNLFSVSHRSGAFKYIYKHTIEHLRELLQIPAEFAIVFTSSATEVWERSIENLRPQRPGFFINGSFSDRFYQIAESINYKSDTYFWSEEGWNFEAYKSLNDRDFIGIAQNETSQGIASGIGEINKIREINPNAFLIVDMVSGLPYYAPDWEKWDSVYFSVQKGFGLPAGLGVWIIRRSKVPEVEGVALHRNLNNMIESSEKYQTQETPNMLDIFLLGKVCEDMNRRGIENIRRESDYKAALINNFVSQSEHFEHHVKIEKYRSKTVIVLECIGFGSERIISYLDKHGIVIGSGYGPHSETHVRIANFPSTSKELFEFLVDKLEEFNP